MEVKLFRDLYSHMEWADALVWRAVLETDAARDDERLTRTLLHIHTVQRAFLSVWRGEAPAFRKRAEFPDLVAMALWAEHGHDELRAQVASVALVELDDVVTLPWAERVASVVEGPPATTTLRDTLLQVPQHSTYHRGQACMRLRELGGVPPLTDYIAWIWSGEPGALWR